MTVRQWFKSKAIIPFSILAILIFTLWAGFTAYQINSTAAIQNEKVSEIASLLQSSILKNDRKNVESLLDSLFLFLNAEQVMLCKESQLLISRGDKSANCLTEHKRFFSHLIEHKVGGLKDYNLRIVTPIIRDRAIVYSSVLGLLMLLGCLFIILNFSKQISRDILMPIANGYLTPNKTKILEVQDLLAKQEEAKQAEAFRAAHATAKQVVHDVRSPLSALQMLSQTLTQVTEDESILFKNSVRRINEILDDLSLKSKDINKRSEETELGLMVHELLLEKKLNCDLTKFTFTTDIPKGTLVRLESKEFKRVLSNLVNNSIEAMPSGGSIEIKYERLGLNNKLSISDSGIGIPKSIIGRLGKSQISFGKKAGQGLGLTHAYKFFEEIGGSMSIISVEKKGTRIEFTF